MEIDSIVKKEIMILICIIALYFISLQLQGLSLETGVAPSYTQFYIPLVNLALIGGVAIAFFQFLKSEEFDIIDSNWIKAGAIITWTVFVVLITTSAGQIWPVPSAQLEGFQITSETEYITSALIPGITEDFTYNFTFPIIIVILFTIVAHIAGIDVDKLIMIGFILGACFITSTGYNIFVVPGFTTAHIPAYGENPQAYAGAFVFSYGQSVVNLMTGWFVPIPHIIHNAMVVAKQQGSFSIGEAPII